MGVGFKCFCARCKSTKESSRTTPRGFLFPAEEQKSNGKGPPALWSSAVCLLAEHSWWHSKCEWVCVRLCVCTLRWFLTHPIYCSGWLWWITILHVGHVLFSSRYFTRQLLQTGDAQQKCTVTLQRAHTHTQSIFHSRSLFVEKRICHTFLDFPA